MSVELPLFPLNIVAFPGEMVNLHIFEPRYKQLIGDCLSKSTTFGIASYAINKIELGTEVKIIEISKKYPDGRMDIKTQGIRSFDVLNFQNPWKDRLYAGGMVEFKSHSIEVDLSQLMVLKELCNELFSWLGEDKSIDVNAIKSSYDIAHKIGLKIEEEYKLLQMERESRRMEFVVNHLKKLIPALQRAHRAKERIKQNGHFRHLDPLKF